MIENVPSNTNLRSLTETEKCDWLRLIRSENVGPITFFRLLQRFGSARNALDNLSDLACQGGRRTYATCHTDRAHAELERLSVAGANLVAWCEPMYPAHLRETEGAPPLLSVVGRTDLMERTAIAVVGARNASANGLGFARSLARDLGKGGYGCQNIVVVSGLARGIDAAAHHGSLEHGTIAVLGGGIDNVYPAENARLYEEIREKGLIVAEMPVGTKPSARLFPIRNRIISGISCGVVVVEASPRSGSLITARLALDQGREVFAVPGAPGDPRSRGTNGLIKDGAILTESGSDVLRVLGDAQNRSSLTTFSFDFNEVDTGVSRPDEITSARAAIKELLGNSSVAVDELVRNCQFSFATVSAVLLEMELAGRLERQPGNRICQIVAHE